MKKFKSKYFKIFAFLFTDLIGVLIINNQDMELNNIYLLCLSIALLIISMYLNWKDSKLNKNVYLKIIDPLIDIGTTLTVVGSLPFLMDKKIQSYCYIGSTVLLLIGGILLFVKMNKLIWFKSTEDVTE